MVSRSRGTLTEIRNQIDEAGRVTDKRVKDIMKSRRKSYCITSSYIVDKKR